MRLDLPLGEPPEVDEEDMSVLHARSCEDEVVVLVGKRDQVVDLIFFESEGFDDVLDLHGEEVDQEHLVVEGNNDLVLPDFDLLDFGVKGQVCNDLLGSCIGGEVRSSKIASLLGGVKGVSFSPTRPIRLLLLISSTNCRGVPKSLSCLRAKGCVL
jgi:hypothetical protein